MVRGLWAKSACRARTTPVTTRTSIRRILEPRAMSSPRPCRYTSSSNMAVDGLLSPVDISPSGIIRRKSLPEDDGMGVLRKRIFAIQAQDIEAGDKARQMHQLLSEDYTKSRRLAPIDRPLTPSSPTSSEQRRSTGPLESFKFWQNILDEAEPHEEFDLTPQDLQPTFAPPSWQPPPQASRRIQAHDIPHRYKLYKTLFKQLFFSKMT